MAGEQVYRPPGAPISGRVTPATFPFYTTGEDNLRIVSFNSVSGVKLRIAARLLGTDGRPTPSTWDHTPNSDRSSASNDFNLSGQTLLNVHVSASAGAALMGQTFVIVQLIRGIGTAAIVLGTILQGAVTATQAIAWPGSAIVSSTDGEPAIRFITGTDPGAGVDIIETVPTGARWELVSITCPIDFTSTVTALTPRLFIKSGGNLFAVANHQSIGGGAYANNMTFAWGAGLPYNVFATFPTELGAGLPNGIKMPAAASIQIPALPNGNWQAPHYIVREWLDV